jgi:predicted methyltransferase
MRSRLATLLLVATSCAHTAAVAPKPSYDALVAAPDRTDADRALDAGRKPAQMLEFLGVRPGMKVAELGASRGYTTELLVRAVGPTGVVYGQNSPLVLQRFAEKPWGERLARPINKTVIRADRDFEAPLPPEVHDLDLVVINVIYHDTVWMKVDRDKMNAAVFAALKPGGAYVVIDSSARAGTGTADAETLHRIDEQVVRDEVAKAGFKLAGTSDFLRNPEDTRDWNSSPLASGPRRGTGDRFALKFVKP